MLIKQNLGDGEKTQLFPKISTHRLGFASCHRHQRYWSGGFEPDPAWPGLQEKKINCVAAGDGNPRDSGCASPLERLPVLSTCLAAHPLGTFRLCLPTQLFFFFLSRCIFLSIHGNTSPPSSGRKPSPLSLSLSLSELEGRDATGVGGNFPTEAFLSSRKCLFKLRRVLCECKNRAHYISGALLFRSLKIPHSRCCIFLATANSRFFFTEGECGWKPPNFPRKTPELKLLKHI